MADGPYRYKAFISYASEDVAWARRLRDELAARRLSVFVAVEDIDPGTPWQEGLRGSLADCEHFVLLGSGHAHASDWVGQERLDFEQRARMTGGRRLLLQVNLGGRNKLYDDLQTVDDLAPYYAAGVDGVPRDVWARVADRLDRSLRLESSVHTVHRAVLAATREELEDVADQPGPASDETLREVVTGLGLDFGAFAAQYDERRTDWRPFGGDTPVYPLMDELAAGLSSNDGLPLRWEDANDDLWGSTDDRKKALNVLSTQPCVVALDPLSIFVGVVQWMLTRMLPGVTQAGYPLTNPRALFLVLGPVASPLPVASVRRILEHQAEHIFEAFFAPAVPPQPHVAQIGMNVADERDVVRMLRRSLAADTSRRAPASNGGRRDDEPIRYGAGR